MCPISRAIRLSSSWKRKPRKGSAAAPTQVDLVVRHSGELAGWMFVATGRQWHTPSSTR